MLFCVYWNIRVFQFQKNCLIGELKPGDFNLDGNESDKNEQFVEFINIVTVPQSLIDEMMQKVSISLSMAIWSCSLKKLH